MDEIILAQENSEKAQHSIGVEMEAQPIEGR
jgi:hypothetical protein